MRIGLIAAAAALLIDIPLVFLGRGTFLHAILALAIPGYVGGPALLVALIAFFFRRRYARSTRLSIIAATIVCITISALATLPFGAMLASHDIREAELYCESFIPAIEQYRKAYGTYPQHLPSVANSRSRPRLIRDASFYSSDGSSFHFSFEDPRGLLNIVEYSSQTARWVEAG